MKKHIRKRPVLALALFCYAAGFAALLLAHFAGFVYNRVLYATGALTTTPLTLEDFELTNDLVLQDGQLISIGADPQLVLKDPNLKVDTLYVEIEYSAPPRQVNVLYAAPGQPYTVRHMVFARQYKGATVFWLPVGGGQNIRLDPGSASYNIITIKSIVANVPRPFYAYFIFTPGQWAALAVVPGLAASAIVTARQGLAAYRGKKAGDAA